jgi:hypothetical protein
MNLLKQGDPSMRRALLSAAAITTLACASAFAADTMTGPSATSPAATAPQFVSPQPGDMLSSNIVGLDVRNGESTNIGKIQDIAFDNGKKVDAYILSVGGFLGLGTHYVAVDPASIAVSYDATNKVWRATMNATKDQLKAAPEFKYSGQWTSSRS